MTNWVIVILIIAAVCVYDLCGLLAVLYINHTDRMDGADNVIVLIFWPLLVVTRIGIAIYRIVRRLL